MNNDFQTKNAGNEKLEHLLRTMKGKVYIVTVDNWDNSYVLGGFSYKQEAEKFIELLRPIASSEEEFFIITLQVDKYLTAIQEKLRPYMIEKYPGLVHLATMLEVGTIRDFGKHGDQWTGIIWATDFGDAVDRATVIFEGEAGDE